MRNSNRAKKNNIELENISEKQYLAKQNKIKAATSEGLIDIFKTYRLYLHLNLRCHYVPVLALVQRRADHIQIQEKV